MTHLNSTRNDYRSSKVNGFTLIEVMITVVIIGILASIAYPGYMSQVRKSRRSDAVQALAQVQQAQERWRANKTSYTAALSTAPPDGLGLSVTTSGGYYTLAISSATANSYVAAASAVTGKSQAGDTGCTALTVTVNNGAATNTPPECWSQ